MKIQQIKHSLIIKSTLTLCENINHNQHVTRENEQLIVTNSAPTSLPIVSRGTVQDEIQATKDKIMRVPIMKDEMR